MARDQIELVRQLIIGVVMTVLFLLVLVASVVGYIIFKSGETVRFETSAASQDVVNWALATAGTSRRWSTISVTDSAGVFSFYKRANLLITFILAWFFILPGVFYYMIFSKRESLSVIVTQSGVGRQAQVVSNGFRGKSVGRQIRTQFETPGSTVLSA